MKKILQISSAMLFAVVFGAILSSALGINAFIGVSSVAALSFAIPAIPGVVSNTLFLPAIDRSNVDRAAAQEFKKQARVLTSYEGGANSYEGGAFRNGDLSMSFAGSERSQANNNGAAFVKEIGTNISYSFKITNAAAADKVVALLPTFLLTAANIAAYSGQTVDGVLTDGTIATSVTGSATDSALKIAYLQEFIKNNPTRIVEMIIQSDSAEQFSQTIVIGQASPFRKLSTNSLDLTDFTPPTNFNDKKAIIPIAVVFPEMQLDNQTLILLPVPTDTSVKVTLKIGLVHNPSSTLYNKATQAWDAMKEAGIVQVQA
jgi:hypothetical protein